MGSTNSKLLAEQVVLSSLVEWVYSVFSSKKLTISSNQYKRLMILHHLIFKACQFFATQCLPESSVQIHESTEILCIFKC